MSLVTLFLNWRIVMTTTSVLFPAMESGFKCQSILRKLFLENELTFLPMDVETFPISLYLSNMPEHVYDKCYAADSLSQAESLCFSFYATSKAEAADLFSIYFTQFYSNVVQVVNLIESKLDLQRFSIEVSQLISGFINPSLDLIPSKIKISKDLTEDTTVFLLFNCLPINQKQLEGIITFELIFAKGKVIKDLLGLLNNKPLLEEASLIALFEKPTVLN